MEGAANDRNGEAVVASRWDSLDRARTASTPQFPKDACMSLDREWRSTAGQQQQVTKQFEGRCTVKRK